MKKYDREAVKAAEEFKDLAAGGYVLEIKECQDEEDKERLAIEYDIAEGPFAGYYSDLYARTGSWRGKMYRYYSEKSRPFFEAFLQAVEGSNNGFRFEWEPESLIGKKVGALLREEEYVGTDRETGKSVLRVRVSPSSYKKADDIRQGNFKIPKRKLLTQDQRDQLAGFEEVPDSEIPF